MKNLFLSLTPLSLAATVLFTGLYHLSASKVILALAITCGTLLYHLAMRLFVGLTIHGIFRNRMNHTLWWFRQKAWEPKLYALLRVQKWKKHVPTFAPHTFQIEAHTTAELLGATCQAEVVHEVIMLLSFLPVVASVWFDELVVFLITSAVAALIDAVFVAVQRYNRPRMVHLAMRESKRSKK